MNGGSAHLIGLTPSEWSALLERERALRSTLFEIEKNHAPKAYKAKAARDWWLVVSEIMDGCVEGSHAGRFDRVLPLDLFRVIGRMSASLAVGTVPEPMQHVVTRGRRATGPIEQRHRAIAAAYIQAARRHDLVDKTPTNTVAEAYGVTRQAAQEWAKQDVSGYGFPIRSLAERMQQAGAMYSRAGRGAKALLARDSKRQAK